MAARPVNDVVNRHGGHPTLQGVVDNEFDACGEGIEPAPGEEVRRAGHPAQGRKSGMSTTVSHTRPSPQPVRRAAPARPRLRGVP